MTTSKAVSAAAILILLLITCGCRSEINPVIQEAVEYAEVYNIAKVDTLTNPLLTSRDPDLRDRARWVRQVARDTYALEYGSFPHIDSPDPATFSNPEMLNEELVRIRLRTVFGKDLPDETTETVFAKVILESQSVFPSLSRYTVDLANQGTVDFNSRYRLASIFYGAARRVWWGLEETTPSEYLARARCFAYPMLESKNLRLEHLRVIEDIARFSEDADACTSVAAVLMPRLKQRDDYSVSPLSAGAIYANCLTVTRHLSFKDALKEACQLDGDNILTARQLYEELAREAPVNEKVDLWQKFLDKYRNKRDRLWLYCVVDAKYNLATALKEGHRWADALKLFREVIEISPIYDRVQLRTAEVLYEQAKQETDPARKRELLEEAFQHAKLQAPHNFRHDTLLDCAFLISELSESQK